MRPQFVFNSSYNRQGLPHECGENLINNAALRPSLGDDRAAQAKGLWRNLARCGNLTEESEYPVSIGPRNRADGETNTSRWGLIQRFPVAFHTDSQNHQGE
jgi:hypothetical protein